MLNYGFSLLKSETIFCSEEVICSYGIKNSLNKEIGIKVKENINVILNKTEKKEDLKIELIMNKIEAPIEEGEEVGCLNITTASGRIYLFKVYSTCKVDKISFGQIFKNNLKIIFS